MLLSSLSLFTVGNRNFHMWEFSMHIAVCFFLLSLTHMSMCCKVTVLSLSFWLSGWSVLFFSFYMCYSNINGSVKICNRYTAGSRLHSKLLGGKVGNKCWENGCCEGQTVEKWWWSRQENTYHTFQIMWQHSWMAFSPPPTKNTTTSISVNHTWKRAYQGWENCEKDYYTMRKLPPHNRSPTVLLHWWPIVCY